METVLEYWAQSAKNWSRHHLLPLWLPLRIHRQRPANEISVTANDLQDVLRDRMNVITTSLTRDISAIGAYRVEMNEENGVGWP